MLFSLHEAKLAMSMVLGVPAWLILCKICDMQSYSICCILHIHFLVCQYVSNWNWSHFTRLNSADALWFKQLNSFYLHRQQLQNQYWRPGYTLWAIRLCYLLCILYFITSVFLLQPLMRALDDMENANAQVEVAVEEVTKARTQKIKVVDLLSSLRLLESTCVACYILESLCVLIFCKSWSFFKLGKTKWGNSLFSPSITLADERT